MKRLLVVGLLLVLVGSQGFATPCDIHLYVDAAPNKYGSPLYAGWESATFTAVSNGTFVNMSN
ncbi:MAG: hypothetical protein KC940_25485, partial [Candidatus Omnitrophica bacterium]|nr:hypothetical protein [Candidatus Omnitrophota bacterium]